MTVAYVGLGSNLDDPRLHVERAILDLDGLPRTRVVKTSSLYRSKPMGYADQPDFVNAVAQLETDLDAPALLAGLQAIEARHGRSRSFPDAPRTLDLDLLLFGDLKIATTDLTVPHPRMHRRAFVLQPLLEITPGATIPGSGGAAALLQACAGQGVERMGDAG